jgi:hypothetical protein
MRLAPPRRTLSVAIYVSGIPVGVDDEQRLDKLGELAARWYVQLLDAGMSQCERTR